MNASRQPLPSREPGPNVESKSASDMYEAIRGIMKQRRVKASES